MNREPNNPITVADVAAYRRDGAVCLRGIFDRDWLDLLAAGMERNIAAPDKHGYFLARDAQGHIYFQDVANWQRIPEFERFIFDSPAVDIAGHMMGATKINIFYEAVFYRTAGTTTPTPWHQDVPYWPIDGKDVCSVWTPLDPVPAECALEFVRGSHRWDKVFRRPSFYDDGEAKHLYHTEAEDQGEETRREPTPDVAANRGAYDILTWELEPGDCISFSGMVFHGARGNQNENRPLRALATRWAGDDSYYAEKPEGTDPMLTGHGLKHGEPFRGPMFPKVWPRQDRDGDYPA